MKNKRGFLGINSMEWNCLLVIGIFLAIGIVFIGLMGASVIQIFKNLF